MNSIAQFEDRASSRRGQYEGEPSRKLCDRLSRTRDASQRQLPTDQDYAVSTREYQTDQSSPKPAPAAARPVLEKPPKQPHRGAEVDRSLHISFWGAGQQRTRQIEILACYAYACQGLSKTRPVGRSKSRPVVGSQDVEYSGEKGRWSVAEAALFPRGASGRGRVQRSEDEARLRRLCLRR